MPATLPIQFGYGVTPQPNTDTTIYPGYGTKPSRGPIKYASPAGPQQNPGNIPIARGPIPVAISGGGSAGTRGFGSGASGGGIGGSGPAQISAGSSPNAGGAGVQLANVGNVQGMMSQLGGAGTNVQYNPGLDAYGNALAGAGQNIETNQRGLAQGQLSSQLKAQSDALRSQVVGRPTAGGGGGGISSSDPSGIGNPGSNLGGQFGGGGGGGGSGGGSGGGGGGGGASGGGGFGGGYGFGVFDANSQYPGGSGDASIDDPSRPQQTDKPLLGTTPIEGQQTPTYEQPNQGTSGMVNQLSSKRNYRYYIGGGMYADVDDEGNRSNVSTTR